MDDQNAKEERARHIPDARQQTLVLDATQRMNAVRLVDLNSVEMYCTNGANGHRIVRYGGQGHKHLLLLLDHHIGKCEGWSLSYALLAVEMDVSESTVYRIAGDLDRVSLIRRKPELGGLIRFSICWSNLFDLAAQQGLDLRGSTKTVRSTTKTVRATANEIRGSTKTVRSSTNAPLIPQNTPPSPPPSPSVAMVVMAVKDAGVSKCVEAVEIAQANGLSLEGIMAVVEHFRSYPGKWEAGALYQRLTLRGAKMMRPDEGWCPAKEGYRSPSPAIARRDDLEAQHGSTLNALTDDEVDGLTAGMSPRWVEELHRFGRTHPHFRPDLLQLLHRRASASVQTAEVGAAS